MASTKTLDTRIAEVQERIAQLENQKKQLVEKQKLAERKARTHRLIERGAILESMIDGADTLTNEQIKTVLAVALNTDAAIGAIIAAQESAGTAVEPVASQQERQAAASVTAPVPERATSSASKSEDTRGVGL